MLEMGSVSPKYVSNMYYNRIYDKKKSLGYGSDLFSNMADGGHLEFSDTACVFGYFFFYGPKELIYQRGPLHHNLK